METTTDRLTRMIEESTARMVANQLKQIEAFEKRDYLKNLEVDMDEWKTLSISLKLLVLHLQGEVEEYFNQIQDIRAHLECTPL